MKKYFLPLLLVALGACSHSDEMAELYHQQHTCECKYANNKATVQQPEETPQQPLISTGKKPKHTCECDCDKEFQVPGEFRVQFKQFSVNPNRDTALVVNGKGTMLNISKNSFVDKKGNLITSAVNLQFREYTNSAEIAFSGIPMTFSQGEDEFNFNSAGMFEIRGDVGGEEVNIQNGKSISVDYALAQKPAGIGFYQLDDETQEWKSVQEIKPLPLIIPGQLEQNDAIMQWQVPVWKKIKKAIVVSPEKKVKVMDVATGQMRDSLIKGEVKLVDDSIQVGWEVKKGKFSDIPKIQGGMFRGIGLGKWPLFAQIENNFVWKDNGDRTTSTLLGGGPNSDPGHSYPDIVKGLNCKTFGVYNCDQIYRVANRVNVMAKYYDEQGNEIKNGKVLSMIDLEYNGAFSFDPSAFVCNAKGKNVLALFTKTGKLYLVDSESFAKAGITASGQYTFTAKDMSGEIKSSKDLAKYIGING